MITRKVRSIFTFGRRKNRMYEGGFWVASSVLFFYMGGG